MNDDLYDAVGIGFKQGMSLIKPSSRYSTLNIKDIEEALFMVLGDDTDKVVMVVSNEKLIPYVKRAVKHSIGVPSAWVDFNTMNYMRVRYGDNQLHTKLVVKVLSTDRNKYLEEIDELSDEGYPVYYVSEHGEQVSPSHTGLFMENDLLCLADIANYIERESYWHD